MSKLITAVCILSLSSCIAQETNSVNKEKLVLVTNEGIIYKFPPNIEKEINEVLNTHKGNSYLIVFANKDSTSTISLYCTGGLNNKDLNPHLIEKVTNRHYKYGDSNIPIIFESDYQYSTPGFTITHSCLEIDFKKGYKLFEPVKVYSIIKN